MKPYLRYLISAIFFFQFGTTTFATHNRAGEIIIEQLPPCTGNMVRCTIITYTKTSSVAADRDSLEICWGDGTCEMVARATGAGSPAEGRATAQ